MKKLILQDGKENTCLTLLTRVHNISFSLDVAQGSFDLLVINFEMSQLSEREAKHIYCMRMNPVNYIVECHSNVYIKHVVGLTDFKITYSPPRKGSCALEGTLKFLVRETHVIPKIKGKPLYE